MTAVIMALALMLVPTLSLGESAAAAFEQKALEAGRSLSTTVTFEPGDLFTKDPSMSMFGDVFKSLSVKTVKQEEGENALGVFTMLLQDQPALTFTATKKGDELHLMSSLMGDSVLSFTPQEFVQLYFTVADAAIAAAEQSGMVPEGLAEMKAQMEGMKSVITGMFTNKTDDTDLTAFALPFKMPEFDQESLQADLMTPVMTWFTGIMSAPEMSTGTFDSEKHDTATTQVVYSISAEKIQELLQIVSDWATKEDNFNVIHNFLSSAGAVQMSGEEAKTKLLQGIADLPANFAKDAAPAMKQPITLTMLMDDMGNTPLTEIKGQFTGKDAKDSTFLLGFYSKTEGEDVTGLFTLDVGTADDSFRLGFTSKEPANGLADTAKAWKFEMSATENGMEAFALALDFAGEEKATETTAEDAWKLNINLNAGGMPIGASLDYKSASAFDGKDVKTEDTLACFMTGLESPVLTIKTVTVSGDPVAYPEIPSDSVRLGKMTIEELTAWGEAAMQTAMVSLMSAMQYLPESVLTMMYGTPATN